MTSPTSTPHSLLQQLFQQSLQPIHQNLNQIEERLSEMQQNILELEQTTQNLDETLQPLPEALTIALNQFMGQLQTMLTAEPSSASPASLQQQLAKLLTTLNSLNQRIDRNTTLQQQLIASLESCKALSTQISDSQ
jgi:Mg2+ and Co2+ transporter CorA